ncbi:MAG: hypothetical protein RSE01_03480 [Akkermansia sp.]
MNRSDLPNILYDIIKSLNGKATMMDVFKCFWNKYGNQLTINDDLFYTWNYDIRWAATKLRKEDRMKPASRRENSYGSLTSPCGIWEIK